MSTSETDEFEDPFEVQFRRDPLPDAAVRVIVLVRDEPEGAVEVTRTLERLIAERGRAAESVVVAVGSRGAGTALREGLEGATVPLVLVTKAGQPWTAEHLDPLLKAIDKCDHAVGRRPLGDLAALGRWLGWLPWKLIFAVPIRDVHSPYQLHRREKLAAFPLQSESAFLDVEILAKATFLGQLLDEVDVPAAESVPVPVSDPVSWRDFVEVCRNPAFLHPSPSGPSEDAEGEHERDDGPDGEDQHRGGDVEPAGPFEDHPPERPDQLGQRQGLDERLDRVGEPLRREEDA
jgi:hypothetical protein